MDKRVGYVYNTHEEQRTKSRVKQQRTRPYPKYYTTKQNKAKLSDDELSGNEADIELFGNRESPNLWVDITTIQEGVAPVFISSPTNSRKIVSPVSYSSLKKKSLRQVEEELGNKEERIGIETRRQILDERKERKVLKDITRIVIIIMLLVFGIILYCAFLTVQISELQNYYHRLQHESHLE